jgi:hypothetical protein
MVISNVPEERGARQKLVANGSSGDLEKSFAALSRRFERGLMPRRAGEVNRGEDRPRVPPKHSASPPVRLVECF